MIKEEIKIKVDGKVVDSIREEKHLLPSLFSLFLNEVELMSDDAIVRNIENSFSLFEEIGIGAFSLKKIKWGRRLLFNYVREDVIRYIFDIFLSGEGLSTLPGFGMAKVEKKEDGGKMIKGRYLINPEKESIYKEF